MSRVISLRYKIDRAIFWWKARDKVRMLRRIYTPNFMKNARDFIHLSVECIAFCIVWHRRMVYITRQRKLKRYVHLAWVCGEGEKIIRRKEKYRLATLCIYSIVSGNRVDLILGIFSAARSSFSYFLSVMVTPLKSTWEYTNEPS